MLRSTLAALAVVTMSALILPTSFVGVAHAWTVGDGCGEGGGGEGCDESPGTPSSEPAGPTSGSGGDGGDLPALTTAQQIQHMEDTCNAALGALVRIPESAVEGFAGGGVSVIGVCDSGIGHRATLDASQALPLQNAIAANPTLAAALRARGYKPGDVVGVVIVDGGATLYAHRSA